MKQRPFYKKPVVSLKLYLRKILHLRTDTHQISLGFAIGAFIGVFPTFGLGFILISILALVIKFNVPAAFVGTAIGNPFFTPFWLFVSYKFGDFILPYILKKEYIQFLEKSISNKFLNFGVDYIVGNLILSIIAGVISYFVVKYFVNVYKKKKEKSMSQTQLGKKI